MKTVKLTTRTGYTWTTQVNQIAADENIVNYFLDQYFDIGVYPHECLDKVVKVEFL